MNEQSERDKLIEMGQVNGMLDSDWADFVIADRRRICEPLFKAKGTFNLEIASDAIDETLKRAGITN